MRALAKSVGVSCNAIKKFEDDVMSPRSSVLVELGKALGVSLDYLAGGTIATLEIISISLTKDSSK
jgi:transcriptional regulator with XRE-family HTH domain